MGTSRAAVVGAGRRRIRWRQTTDRMFDLELDAEITQVRQRLEASALRKRRHDLINAFTAVEGAAMILTRETLSAADRATLAEVLRSGLSRLRALLLASADVDRVALSDLTAALLDEPLWHDRVQVEVAPDLVVAGSPGEISEAVRQLLTYVSGRTLAGPITVRSHRNGDRVEVWVDDLGPSLTPRQRREMGEPDRRRPFGSDAVSRLHVAIQLARAQGGGFTAVARPDGGESFRFSWPECVG